MKMPVIIINAAPILEELDADYLDERLRWEQQCKVIEGQFRKKTSRSVKNGKEYEYTGWYQIKPDGGLESIGKDAPDFKKYYPPEPKPKYLFKFKEYDGNVILDEKDYLANQKTFKECLVFMLEECLNYTHPLYKNIDKALDSVRNGAGISARSPGKAGQKNTCVNDGDCDSCEHNDRCPVFAEKDEE